MAAVSGRVVLVGAGIGDLSITVAGVEALRAADAVLHDRLVPASLLAEARGDAMVIDVGVRGGEAGAAGRQAEISRRMISLAREGKLVVRLKGGDPFVFGRGGEEVSALAEAGVAVEVIPGVSAALAAPALAGIPVTDRRAASAFTVVTGVDAPGAPPVDWEALARVGGTIVVLMGGRRAGEIGARLIAAGLDPATPAAAISAAGSAGQRNAFATLGGLGRAVAESGMETPITLVIGAVAALAPGRGIPGGGDRAADALRETASSMTEADDGGFGSGAGARMPATRPAEQAARPAERLPDGGWAGARPAEQAAGPAGRRDAGGTGALAGVRVLVTRPAEQAAGLAGRLRDAGAVPVLMPAIELRPPADGHAAADGAARRLAEGGFDWAVFTSANGVERFRARLGAGGLDARAFGGVRVAAIGPATSAALAGFGIRADVVAEPHTTSALAGALAARAAGMRVLLARSAEGDPGLAEALRAAGAEVSDAAVYQVATARGDAAVLADLAAGRIDVVTFTSPSTVRGLVALAGIGGLRGARVACIGPVTAGAARELGLGVDVEAAVHTAEGLVEALAASVGGAA